MDHIKVCMLVVVMLLVGVTSSAHQESAEEQLTASQKRKGSDASVDRSILVPTAETISAGDFTFNSYELFFAGLSYGVSDRLQVSVATLLPIFESFPFTLYGSLKSQLVSTERCVFSVQFGGLVFHQQGDTEGLVNLSGMLDLLLDKVYPCHEVVKMDYHLPGCPPTADTLWEALVALLTDKPVELPYELIKYD